LTSKFGCQERRPNSSPVGLKYSEQQQHPDYIAVTSREQGVCREEVSRCEEEQDV
jgi:hypothetical protein